MGKNEEFRNIQVASSLLLLFSLTHDFLNRAKQEGKSLLVKEEIKISLFADGIILTEKTPETPQMLSLSKTSSKVAE